MANRVYAPPGLRMARQLGGDVFVVAWLVGWALAGRALHRLVGTIAGPARASGEAAASMATQMQQAQGQVSRVPGVGDTLSQPFGGLSDGLQQIVAQADRQVVLLDRLAVAAGWLCFLVPALTALAWWLPRRIRFIRTAAAARRVIDADEDLSLFALRAMANMPVHELARISPDPVGEWRRGNPEVVRRLAALELERTGLAMPEPVRRVGAGDRA